jgi:hypothetical protein
LSKSSTLTSSEVDLTSLSHDEIVEVVNAAVAVTAFAAAGTATKHYPERSNIGIQRDLGGVRIKAPSP